LTIGLLLACHVGLLFALYQSDWAGKTYGNETFLFAPESCALLIPLAASGTRTRLRILVLAVACALIALALGNNVRQFGEALRLASDLPGQIERPGWERLLAREGRPAETAPGEADPAVVWDADRNSPRPYEGTHRASPTSQWGPTP
jgi:hypothetical protein